jgi:hypothetical protein
MMNSIFGLESILCRIVKIDFAELLICNYGCKVMGVEQKAKSRLVVETKSQAKDNNTSVENSWRKY